MIYKSLNIYEEDISFRYQGENPRVLGMEHGIPEMKRAFPSALEDNSHGRLEG